jgi:hypothetical protein
MKVEIEVNDIETLAKALNNAFVAYSDIVSCINVLGIEPQLSTIRYLPLMSLSAEELDQRYNALKDLYLQIETKEKEQKEV